MLDIIIPAYNAAGVIERLFASLENQSVKEFKAVFVNDGSTDNTYELCTAEAARCGYEMLVLTQKNKGPAGARRYGLEHCTAEYVMFCDADDYLRPDAIETVCTALNKSSPDVLEFGFEKVDSAGNRLPSLTLKDRHIEGNCFENYIKQINTTNYLCNKVFRRNLIELSDFADLSYSEDARALAFIFSRCAAMDTISDRLYYYVRSEDSACGRKYNHKRLDMLKADEDILRLTESIDASLVPFEAGMACVHITKLYAGLYNAGLLDAALDGRLRALFKERYKLMKENKGGVYATKSRRQIAAAELFRLSPVLFRCAMKTRGD